MDIYASTARTSRRSCDPQRPSAALNLAPADFDATANPIIAKHFFGVESFCPTATVAVEAVTGLLRRQRQIEHVYLLGARAVGELLYEVAEGGDLDRALAAYERLTPALLAAMGADRFPPSPIHEIPTS